MTPSKPRMIFFDYGQTLLHEHGFDHATSLRALAAHFYPKEKINLEEMIEFGEGLHEDLRQQAFANSVEVPFALYFNFILDYFDLSCDLPLPEAEEIYWFTSCPAEAMPGVSDFLREINERGIRSAVISNLPYSKLALQARIDKHLPENNFEFFVSSNETCLRKPFKWIFLSALKKSGLKAEECWYIGDNIYCDLEGSLGVGMHPIWFNSGHACFYDRELDQISDETRQQVDIVSSYDELLQLIA